MSVELARIRRRLIQASEGQLSPAIETALARLDAAEADHGNEWLGRSLAEMGNRAHRSAAGTLGWLLLVRERLDDPELRLALDALIAESDAHCEHLIWFGLGLLADQFGYDVRDEQGGEM